MASRIAGVASWSVGTRALAVRGNLTVSVTPFERKGIAGQDYVHGYAEDPVVPYIEGDVSLQPGTTTADIDAVDNETITVQAADGRVFVLREAWKAERTVINTKEGQYRVRFEGVAGREIV